MMSNAHISHTGSVILENGKKLKDVLLVPEFRHNLLFINKLVKDEGWKAVFHSKYCVIQDSHSQIVKDVRITSNGLYYLASKSLREVKENLKDLKNEETTDQNLEVPVAEVKALR
ncbi:EARP and GARP complex-interacting protein 1, partial [Bienertia sinuspersici]